MAEQDNGVTTGGEPLPNGADTLPQVGLISQYVKDLSFENPNAPAIYQSQQAPEINVQFDIGSQQVADEVHEVTLKVEIRAESAGTVAFLVELAYAGLFGLRNVPSDAVQPFLLGEGPRLLFPSRGGRCRARRRLPAAAAGTDRLQRPLHAAGGGARAAGSGHRRQRLISPATG